MYNRIDKYDLNGRLEWYGSWIGGYLVATMKSKLYTIRTNEWNVIEGHVLILSKFAKAYFCLDITIYIRYMCISFYSYYRVYIYMIVYDLNGSLEWYGSWIGGYKEEEILHN